MIIRISFLFLLFFSLVSNTKGQQLKISYYVDASHQMTIEKVNQVQFEEAKTNQLNFANTNDAIWIKIQLPQNNKNTLLEVANPLLDTLDIYRKIEGKFEKERYGVYLPFSKGEYETRTFLFDVNDSEVIYLMCSGRFPLEIPINLTNQKEFNKNQTASNFFFGAYFGILFALFMYNFFLLFSVREKVYIYYLGYLVFVGLFYAMLTGYAQAFLFPNQTKFNSYLVTILSVGMVFIIEFCSQYLKVKENSKKNYWVSKFIVFLCLILGLADVFLDNVVLIALSQVLSLIISLYLILLGIYLLIFKKQKQARIYVLAWTGYLTGISLLILQINGAIPSNFITKNAIFIGSATEVILFSIALAMRINKYRKEKAIAQKNELKQLKLNQDLIKNQKEELQQKVEERTIELKDTVEELETSLSIITTQNDKITRLHEGVTSSINYAKRIQQALLPFEKRMAESMKNHFVLYMPRDIVSGDFYWFSDLGDKIIAIQSDCTGHGVPGAFMSVIGINILEEIVNMKKITDPSQILTEVDNLVRYSLKQSENQGQDGMDMSIVCLYKNERKIELAGAMNSVYLIENGEIQRIKGDKFSIGGWRNQGNKTFTTHTIFPKNTIYIYQTTDGYQDQFGGVKNKKFGSKRLTKTFLEIHQQPMKKQEEFLRTTITNWMEEAEETQIDDISIFGLEY
ncbi:7TM diverse intracellular signaling domain-containing protein [Bernardetia sp.]|uniref:7TM diverse intracellular signaling domain-containing protein n=1 Tax=Bernardetia sp. TaxID=1937974 RepID=UPI0025C2513C|nr:7TM diverse intracellular signaling domain-containing protein [Bernardetia sp.]